MRARYLLAATVWLASCGGSGDDAGTIGETSSAIRARPPRAPRGNPDAAGNVGERLFVENRFAQLFKAYLDGGGAVNDTLPSGDPVMDFTVTTDPSAPLPGPFSGLATNCRGCHLVDEQVGARGGGMRSYADFARRSPRTDIGDGTLTTPRNSPTLVNATLARPGGILLHFDAEFATSEDLVVGAFTGRNFGWRPGQGQVAIANLARIVREDDGTGAVAQMFDGLPYRVLLAGVDPRIPDDSRLTREYRIDVAKASDRQILKAVAKLVSAYMDGLRFSGEDDASNPVRSPFDVFVALNGLPDHPAPGESPLAFSRRLRARLEALHKPKFVYANPNTPDGKFELHDQPFRFGPEELRGLQIFLAEPRGATASRAEVARGKIGNCLACHPAPDFTDFALHNTGTTQHEYDTLHGAGSFAQLYIPGLFHRTMFYDRYLPATEEHPHAREPFRQPAESGDPLRADLGVWNIFANPDFPGPQQKIRAILCAEQGWRCPPDALLLPTAIARFKTPPLRDLGHSQPYMHDGAFDRLEDVVSFYVQVSAEERQETLRNGARELGAMALTAADVGALTAFLRALNEDYQ